MSNTNTSHMFSVDDAIKYGTEEACLLQNLRFWIAKNLASKNNINDGYAWTYNTSEAFSELMPYIGARKMQRMIVKLEECGAIITALINNLIPN